MKKQRENRLVSMYKPKGRKRYMLAFFDPRTGKRRKKSAFRDKRATTQLREQLVTAIERRDFATLDRLMGDAEDSLNKLLGLWTAELRANNRTDNYIAKVENRLRAAFDWMDVHRVQDLRGDSAMAYLADLLKQGLSAKTRDHYASTLKQFGEWLLDDQEVVTRNPFRRLRRVATQADETFTRRPFSLSELRRLVEAAQTRPVQAFVRTSPRAKEETIDALEWTGRQRGILYLFAAMTGMRVDEIRKLEWGDLSLTGDKPTFRVRASTSLKTKRTVVLPLAKWVRDELVEYRNELIRRERRTIGQRERVVHVYCNVARHVRKDAAWAEIEWDPDRERVDFHALRTSCATILSELGVPPKKAQSLLRHTDIRMTMQFYTRDGDLSTAVDSVPDPWSDGVGACEGAKHAPNMADDDNACPPKHRKRDA